MGKACMKLASITLALLRYAPRGALWIIYSNGTHSTPRLRSSILGPLGRSLNDISYN